MYIRNDIGKLENLTDPRPDSELLDTFVFGLPTLYNEKRVQLAELQIDLLNLITFKIPNIRNK